MIARLEAALASLESAPPIGLRERRWCVRLEDAWVPVGQVRHVLSEDPALARRLQERDIPLDWVTLPDISSEELERLPDATALEASLEEVDRRFRDGLTSLLGDLRQKAKEAGIVLPHSKRDPLRERVVSILGGVTQSLEADLPFEARKKGEAVFLVTNDEGRWQGSQGEGIDLRSLIRHAAGQFGALERGAAELVADVVLARLREGMSPLPEMAVERTDEGFRLLWRRSVIGERSGASGGG